MYSISCKESLEERFAGLGITVWEIGQGVIDIRDQLSAGQLFLVKEALLELGYEILDDTNSKLLDRISEGIDDLIFDQPEISRQDYPQYLIKKLRMNYSEVTDLFLQVHGLSLSRYIIMQQVERIKEMLLYEEKTIKEIAAIFHFKNRAQLSGIFKQVTGLTPAYYKQLKKMRSEFREKMNPEDGALPDAGMCE